MGKFSYFPRCNRVFKKAILFNYLIVIVTNQSGIARGMYTELAFKNLMQTFSDYISHYGITDIKVLYCPHHPDGKIPEFSKYCDCRKPKAGMIKRAEKEFKIDLKKSIMIGDKISDVLAGHNAGIENLYFLNRHQGAELGTLFPVKQINSLESISL